LLPEQTLAAVVAAEQLAPAVEVVVYLRKLRKELLL
jgi:hypothetical protein